MPMMREQYRLSRVAEFREQAERARCSRVVETREKIIADEGQRLAAAKLQKSQAQRQEQLVAGAFAHARDRNAGAIPALANEHRRVALVIVGAEPFEGSVGGDREERRGARQQRVLHGGAVPLDRIGGETRGGDAGQPPRSDADELRPCFRLVVGGARRIFG